MRVGFYGNICNNHYQIAKALRLHTDIDAHLYIDQRADTQQQPASDDPELRSGYPSWIHFGDYAGIGHRLRPWSSPLVREIRAYDLIVVSGSGPSFAQFAGPPYAFLTAGGDLTLMPFPLQFWFHHRRFIARAGSLVGAIAQRRGIRRAAQIWTQPFAPFQNALRKLGVRPDRIAPAYFPVMIDTDRVAFRGDARADDLQAARQITERFDFVIFHPSRIMMSDGPNFRATGQWKGNDTLFRAFAKFLASGDRGRAGLVVIDRAAGFEIDAGKRLIADLGIDPNVLWLQPPRPDGFTRDELVVLYSLADVVADEFGVGWFGSIVLEGLAVGRPVLSYVDEEAMRQLYPWHPILSAATVDGNAELMARLFDDRQEAEAVGRRGRDWVEQFHSHRSAGRLYAERFRELAMKLVGA